MKTYSRSIKSPCPLGELSDKYENYCRLCLTKDNIMIHIFNEDEIVPLPLKLKYCIALDVSEDDGLPCGICTDCISKLDESYAFKKRCLATDVKLRQYLQLPYPNSTLSANESVSKESTITATSGICSSKDACTIKMEDNGLIFLNEFCNTINKMGNANNIIATTVDLSNMGIESNNLTTFDAALNSEPINIDNNYCTNSSSCGKDNTIEELQENLNINFSAIERGQPGITMSQKPLQTLPQSMKSYESENEFGNDDEVDNTDEDDINSVTDNVVKPTKTTYKCTPCNTTFFNYRYLLNHKHTSHAELIKICSFCPKTFLTNSTLERHLRVHTGERPYNCEHCGKQFSQKEILNRHVLLHVQGKSKTFKCNDCNYMCYSEDTLARHAKIRHSENRLKTQIPKYQCTKCEKAFYHPSGLSRHQAAHSGIIYRCTGCVKFFSDKSSVRRHFTKVHSLPKSHNVKYYQIESYHY